MYTNVYVVYGCGWSLSVTCQVATVMLPESYAQVAVTILYWNLIVPIIHIKLFNTNFLLTIPD